MKEKKSYHMPAEDFRKYGHALIDWIADYRENVSSYPVVSTVNPGGVLSKLPEHPPGHGESFEDMMKDVENILLPGITHWQSPNFFAYFPSNASEPSILGELLSAGLGVQGMLWATSPACTELETRVLDWLVEMLDLPESFLSTGGGGGVLQDSASSAALCALISAREKATHYQSNARGCDGSLTAYASTQTHSSVEKAVRIAGIGTGRLRMVDVDEKYAMKPRALEAAIKKDREEGLTPFFVCATIGTTSSNAVDPLPAIGRICKKEGIWLHVDAAMAGTAALCPEFRTLQKGLEYADSYCFNPHKWMFTNFDCDCFFVSDRKPLIHALSILPEYLRNKATESGAVIDYRDWQIPLGRRFRALKLWFVIRHYGVEGLRHHIREHVRLAGLFASRVKEDKDFELAARVPLNLVCFRHKGGDAFNEKLLERLNRSGELFLTHTRLDGRMTLRMSIGQTNTTEEHVTRAWEKIRTAANMI